MTDVHLRTFAARSGAGPRPWRLLLIAIPALVVAIYLLGYLIVGIVAVITTVIAVPLAIRHRRIESTSEVDVGPDVVVHRRGGVELTRVRRRAPGYEVVVFADQYGITPQMLVTDGTHHIRLVRGQWRGETLDELGRAAATGVPRVSTWKQVKQSHAPALTFWERHQTPIIVGTVIGIPLLVIVGGVLAVLLFDVG
ncbi:hypothetical protein [Aeromicrobium fastidiosum]|uniref:Uncharacterized protein n=1 Tax=Aeromicrobium fastidiosum TaxID=52699 RepID=A0A641AJS2_9ACTN|nr:hypothetical protein [Aeromicrobium fastidiosum]KAA1373004.1 hypothetical protein ESP62_018095 [Aeromicrobium fastidiosum]MBP2390976.1 hypothetical protein [Aeromicrobium fastidiosum]